MLMERFINNGEMPLAAGINLVDTQLTVTGGVTAGNAFSRTFFARATLSEEGSDDVEVVYITSMNRDTQSLTVIRGREETTARAWPAGAKLECRVTAGMLSNQKAYSLFNEENSGLSIAFGENIKLTNPDTDEVEVVKASWAIGGTPVVTGVGGDWAAMARSVEGLGASVALELGVAPDFAPGETYYPGAVVRDPNPPHANYSRSVVTRLGALPPALAAEPSDQRRPPWVEHVVDADGGVFRVGPEPDWDDPDVWFYPSEIGFICDQHSATSTPTVSVGEIAIDGTLVSKTNLVNAKALTGIDGAHQRIVLAKDFKQGVQGMIFSIDTPAAGGSFKGYFYWKGIFLCSSTAAGWPAEHSLPDGKPA